MSSTILMTAEDIGNLQLDKCSKTLCESEYTKNTLE